MIPKPAQYLLRIDDLCPAIERDNWARMRALVHEFDLHPILAVVPDNQDPELEYSSPDPAFWHELLHMQAAGSTIALHGYRHLCQSKARSLVDLHNESEFAGLPIEIQKTWIQDGLQILRGHGLSPQVFVAPRHGFDRQTLRALRDEGMTYISDGFARVPGLRDNVTWIPQQLWSPLEKSRGLWTICLHTNTMKPSHFAELESFVSQHRDNFTSFKRIQSEFPQVPLPRTERVYERLAHLKMKLRRRLLA